MDDSSEQLATQLATQLAARDRFRRKLALRETPAQRWRDTVRFQEASWERLRRSPAGYAHFLRRNFKARAIAAPVATPRPDAR